MFTVNSEDTKTQQQFWNKMTQFKFDLNYFSYHLAYCVDFIRWWKIGVSVLTALTTGAWMSWGDNSTVKWTCAIIIFILQGVNAASELLPFENRKRELREMIILLEPLYEVMEADWLRIVDGEMSKEQIAEKVRIFETKKRNILQHYLKDDVLPEIQKIRMKAKEETDQYIKTNLL